MPSESPSLVIERPPQTDDELWELIATLWGRKIPRKRVCPGHCSPFDALAEAYFGRSRVTVWKASRGLGGKSTLLALLSQTEAAILKASVSVLGGSGSQSRRVLEEMDKGWRTPLAPSHLLSSEPGSWEIKLTNGAKINALLASQTSTRGPHKPRVRLDEVDEMKLAILNAALGQAMSQDGVPAQTVLSCFTPETPITMLDGTTKPIGAFEVGDKVLGLDGRVHVVKAVHRHHRIGLIHRVTPRGLPALRVTPEHMFIASDGSEVPTIELNSHGGFWSTRRRMTGATTSFDAGWLVGLYLAEGNLRYPTAVTKVGRLARSYEITFSLHQKEALVVSEVIERWARRRYPTKKRTIKARVYADRRGQSASLRVTSRGLHGLINRWVTGRTSDTKRLRQLPIVRSFADGLLRGWMAGDGTKYDIKQSLDKHTPIKAIGSTVSMQLARQLLQVSTDLGYNTSLKVYPQYGMGSFPVWTVNIRPTWDSRRGHARKARHGVSRPAAIETEHYDGEVIDLTVEPGHCYIAGGVVCHNSTHHNVNGTMTAVLKMAAEKGWPVREWCFKETLEPHGWLTFQEMGGKKSDMPKAQWEIEVELQEPSPEGRAIQQDKVEAMFDAKLGTFEGREGEYIEIEGPEPTGLYCTGADWGRKVHWAIIPTYRVDVRPWRMVAFERMGRRAWPQMIERLNVRGRRFKGMIAHDATGLGDVVAAYLTVPVDDVILVGRTRSDILSEYVVAVEAGELKCPMIEFMYAGHKYATNDDLYGAGHPPDDIVAASLAWSLRKKIGTGGVAGIGGRVAATADW